MNIPKILSRREMLAQCSTGFGLMALQGLMASPSVCRPIEETSFQATREARNSLLHVGRCIACGYV